jgi:hypothetical protein
MGLEPMSRTLVALTALYLNVRQRKLGTIIIQTLHCVHIQQHDSADIVAMLKEDFFKLNLYYFQITQPGSGTVSPSYKWKQLAQYHHLINRGR